MSMAVVAGQNFNKTPVNIQDLDLIEILWRQDIDLGIGREAFDAGYRLQLEKERELELHKQREKEKYLEQQTDTNQDQTNNNNNNNPNIVYVLDQETGELVPTPAEPSIPDQHVPFTHTAQTPQEEPAFVESRPVPEPQNPSEQFSVEEAMRLLEEADSDINMGLQELGALISSPDVQYTNDTGLVEVGRQNSSEQRWEDLAGLLPLEEATHVNESTLNELSSLLNNITNMEMEPGQYQDRLLYNASLAPQPQITIQGQDTQPFMMQGQTMLSPVNRSGHLLPTSSLGLSAPRLGLAEAGGQPFINSSETLLQQLLSDNIPDLGLDNTNLTELTDVERMEVNDSASDSAISSGGVSCLSSASILSPTQDLTDLHSDISSPYDTLEGATGGSNDGESSSPRHQETGCKYKYEPDYDSQEYSYTQGALYSNHSDTSNGTEYDSGDNTAADPHQVNHNHTYPLQPGQSPKERKTKLRHGPEDGMSKSEKEQYTRDQKRMTALGIPFTMNQMIDTTVERFNEILQDAALNEAQLQLVRDIRRRGKNKVAAQNCRKRKLEVIHSLDEEVESMRRDRDRLRTERRLLEKEKVQMRQKYSHLYTEVFRSLRDEDGRPYDPDTYTLQQTDDGDMLLVPLNATSCIKEDPKPKTSRKRKQDRKGQ